MNAPLLVLLLVGQASGQSPTTPAVEPADNKAEADEARSIARLLAGEYVVQLDKSSDQTLKLEAEPVFRWLLQLDRRFYSDVYVWTHEGRPEVVASITNVYGVRRAMETEIHSLSTGQPVMLHGGAVVWEPDRPGLALQPLPGAPKPGSTETARLKQMRTLAGEFSVTADYGNMKTEELRLLTTPIYRYASEKRGIADGALFAFTRGTDPDALLMIEARKDAGETQWQYSLVRFCGHCSLRAMRDGREIWQVEKLPTAVNTDPKQPYFGLRKYSDFPVVK